ncbi:MAG: agmatinase [Planctomycetota bacterium]|jgi:agmatinase
MSRLEARDRKGRGVEGRTYLPTGERFLGLDDERADPERAGFVLIPVPFERTSSYGRGSSGGPAAILAASHQVEFHDTELGYEPWAAAGGIATMSPLAIGEADDGQTVVEKVEEVVGGCLDRGKAVVTLAGEHTGVVGAIRAHARRFDRLTVLQLDAHSDMRRTYLDDPWNHACTMARVLDFHREVVQVGIRSESLEDAGLVQEYQVRVFPGAGIQRDADGRVDWIAPIIDACSENVYVTLDCDVLDPSVMPATGTPEPGGLTWTQLNELLTRLCRRRCVVGFDLSELAPVRGLRFPEFTAAKLVYRFIGWIGRAHGS